MDLSVYESTESHPALGVLSPNTRLHGFFELGHYLIEAPFDEGQLFADDAKLDLNSTGEYWVWQPGHFSGEVELELVLPSLIQPIRYIADVGPAQHKSGREQYAEYLSQIVDYAPALVAGTEPAKHGLGGRSVDGISLWIRYARLRQFIGRYLSGATLITQRPVIRHTNHREQVPLPMAKRVDTRTLLCLISSPGLMASLANDVDSRYPSEYRNDLLDVPFHEPTLDNPANRLMTRQLGDVRRLVRGLVMDMEDYKEKASDTVTKVASRIPRRIAFLQAIDKQLTQVQRSEPYASADPNHPDAAALNAIAGNPHYNMTHRIGIRLLRLGLADLADDEQHYLAPTWEIYEAWCFVAIARAVESHFPDHNWSLDSKPKHADLILRGMGENQTVLLYYQMVCKSLETLNAHGYSSISAERRPDLVLEITDSDGKRFILLDSKYSALRRQILAGMESAHIYRDSLRGEGSVTNLSLILVPAITDSNSQLSDLLTSENYWNQHKVGCYPLSTPADAVSLIERIFNHIDS